MVSEPPPTRKLTIVAKDPGLRLGGAAGPLALAQVAVPAELLATGPTGYRVKVVDYNASERRAYRDEQSYQDGEGNLLDPFAPQPGEALDDPGYQRRILSNPNFHAQNAYTIVMRTLGAFERALGRRVCWSSGGHQLHVAPHAFAQANAFYSEPDRALLFGYFLREDGSPIFTCLSHDIVAHETTHALLDGIRSYYTEPSGPDQAGFHEGFADIVALLSIFSMKPVVAAAIGEDGQFSRGDRRIPLVNARKLTPSAIRKSILLGMAAEVGRELEGVDRGALRQSVLLTPREGRALRDDDDEHGRGEVIVAATMKAFIRLWSERIDTLGTFGDRLYNLDAVVDEGAKVAGHLLTMAIRALDYCPPVDLDFGQYLAALLTADRELVPDDEHNYRPTLRASFKSFGIMVPRHATDGEGCWARYPHSGELAYARSNYQAMTRSPDELFRFIWENRAALGVSERAYTEVLSIDASTRVGPDGIALHETVCQYAQRVDIFGAEFKSLLGCAPPEGMRTTDRFTAYGGGVLILDQYGQLKYHIANPILDRRRQLRRGQYLVDSGRVGAAAKRDRLRFALAHQHRMGA